MDLIKVYNRKTGLYSHPSKNWTKTGKTWTSKTAFKNHMTLAFLGGHSYSFLKSIRETNAVAPLMNYYLSKKYHNEDTKDIFVITISHDFSLDKIFTNVAKNNTQKNAGDLGTEYSETGIFWTSSPLMIHVVDTYRRVIQREVKNLQKHSSLDIKEAQLNHFKQYQDFLKDYFWNMNLE